ncbi:hypothetical protein BC826DRAFT_480661 [Russula brevipes]|nr:hypothetical protein BC826DRAFT_480661 [Russula brevipes]
MAPLSYICQSLSLCYTDLFCSSSRRQSLSAPTATTTWICPKLEVMGLDGCTALDWDPLRSFVESRLPAHVRTYPRQAVPPMVALLAPASYSAFASTATTTTTTLHQAHPAPLGCSHLVPPNVSSFSWPLRLKSLHSHHQLSHIVARRKHNRSLDVGFVFNAQSVCRCGDGSRWSRLGFRCLGVVMVDSPFWLKSFGLGRCILRCAAALRTLSAWRASVPFAVCLYPPRAALPQRLGCALASGSVAVARSHSLVWASESCAWFRPCTVEGWSGDGLLAAPQ